MPHFNYFSFLLILLSQGSLNADGQQPDSHPLKQKGKRLICEGQLDSGAQIWLSGLCPFSHLATPLPSSWHCSAQRLSSRGRQNSSRKNQEVESTGSFWVNLGTLNSRGFSAHKPQDNIRVKTVWLGFPGAVVENLPANAGDTGSSLGLGRSHMPRSD